MKKINWIFSTLMLLFSINCAAQNTEKEIFCFAITDYFKPINDSMVIAQVFLPGNTIKINEKQLGLVRPNFTNHKNDTARIGWGRCNLIKGQYYYFGLNLYNKTKLPMAKDLLYLQINYPALYKGRIYRLIKNAIYFEKITDTRFYDFETALNCDEPIENSLIDSLVEDIKYTGKIMNQQMPEQNVSIKGGLFNGMKLFTAMQNVTANDVNAFLDYVNARPSKYAGNTWKISETFATWLISETPTVIKD